MGENDMEIWLSAKWGTSLNSMFLLTFETFWKRSLFFPFPFGGDAIQFSDWMR